jgi:hypothetical protein
MDTKENTGITPENDWASLRAFLRELAESQAASSAKFDREMEKSSAKFDREMEKIKKTLDETAAIQKENAKMFGGMANSNGDFAEEFFHNALERGQKNFFGEEFEDVEPRNKVTVNKGFADEYDFLLFNGRAVCIVDVKYKADSADLAGRVLRKAETFRVNFPQHQDKKVYLAVAALSFNPLTEDACKKSGIAIMKQEGNAMVVSDENLKVF